IPNAGYRIWQIIAFIQIRLGRLIWVGNAQKIGVPFVAIGNRIAIRLDELYQLSIAVHHLQAGW
ncbi:MAG: hypothetical protein MUD01_25965, partial [Chloroflexaceae bacterium]|nr:hypothetical protein [Chloroflexaceae bacterium]